MFGLIEADLVNALKWDLGHFFPLGDLLLSNTVLCGCYWERMDYLDIKMATGNSYLCNFSCLCEVLHFFNMILYHRLQL